jgi:hypothetical protein
VNMVNMVNLLCILYKNRTMRHVQNVLRGRNE